MVGVAHSFQSMTERENEIKVSIRNLNIWYQDKQAIKNVSLDIKKNKVTAVIGPSGCGKSTFIRAINRMNDIIPEARVEGKILLDGKNIYPPRNKKVNNIVLGDKPWYKKIFFSRRRGEKILNEDNKYYIDVVEVRRKVGMVFQRTNPFPKSIFENVAYGLKINKSVKKKSQLWARVEQSLKDAALWDEVKDRLNHSALDLSGGQQQRLCIARALAVEPEVVLFDEPCSALDPVATAKIEELIQNLKDKYTIVIVTHNMQQAARISDFCAFLMMGELVEFDRTEKIFTAPSKKVTEDYITGRFG